MITALIRVTKLYSPPLADDNACLKPTWQEGSHTSNGSLC